MSSDPSLLIESINWYRGLMDAATLLVAIGLIGEYWEPLRRIGRSLKLLNWRAAKLRLLKIAFPLLVVIGVAGEFTISLRVSLIENAWEISQLPRTLSGEQQTTIAKKLKQFSGTHFDFEMHQDLEPMVLLDEIENVLALAGWQEQPTRPGRQTFDRVNRPPVAIGRTIAGVWILWPTGDGSFKAAADAFRDELKANGIVASSVEIANPEAFDLDKVHIWIGERPIPEANPQITNAMRPARRRYPKAPYVEDSP
jgi:hypothetical protein